MAAAVGNNYAAKARVWTEAINRALERRRAGKSRTEALDELAEKLLDLCDRRDLAALQELGNRLEGKPAQTTTITGADGGPVQLAWPLPKTSLDQ